MGDKFVEMILEGLAKVFGATNEDRTHSIIEMLFTLLVPSLEGPFFESSYAFTWALGILLGLVFGVFSSTVIVGRVLHGTTSIVEYVVRITFVLQVLIVGLVAPPLVAAALQFANELTEASLLLPGTGGEEGISAFATIASYTSPIDAAILGGINWLAGLVLFAEVGTFTYLVLPAVVGTPIFYGLSIAGRIGLAMWRGWLGFLLLTITVKPAVAWTLAFGSMTTSWLEEAPGPTAEFASILALAITIIAAFVPLALLYIYVKDRGIKDYVRPAMVRSSASYQSSDSSWSKRIAYSAAAGGSLLLARQQGMSSSEDGGAPRTAGTKRMKASSALGTVGTRVAAAHPVVGAATTATAAGMGAWGHRAGTRAERKTTLQRPAPPSHHSPYTKRPGGRHRPVKPTNPPRKEG